MYAEIIISISHEQIDRPFTYRIPPALEGRVLEGTPVEVPFGNGNRVRSGYCIGLTETCSLPSDRVKTVSSISERGIAVESRLIALAAWMHREYGCTMIQALHTVMPVKEEVPRAPEKVLVLTADRLTLDAYIASQRKTATKRLLLLKALRETPRIPWSIALRELSATAATAEPLIRDGICTFEFVQRDFNALAMPARVPGSEDPGVSLNAAQQAAVDGITEGYQSGDLRPCLIHGVTGSGKTEVYIHLIERFLHLGKSIIVLIPEISLTWQTMRRFYGRFGDMVSMVNSRLSPREKYEQFERARAGDVRIMIGPRSALFTPFDDLGLIIIDEEHETAYQSEKAPRYHARETAIERARLAGGLVVLGSATPSMESYSRCQSDAYRLFTLPERAVAGSRLADTAIVDLREELREGNRSIFSRILDLRMEECLSKHEQMILFLNRRGYSRTVSCRTCGDPVGCPHCAVPLTEHFNKRMICHYCGYTIPTPKVCPTCGSPYLSGFGLGTERVEEAVKIRFPEARVLRMDSDTTSGKDGHTKILQAFASGEADVLIGTQMIVKGHDFPTVTLVGILAADMSLYSGNFRSGERTFQLLTQAAGRAGRGDHPGHVVIQTYAPEHSVIQAAARQDYKAFFQEELRFRRELAYPPAGFMCHVMTACLDARRANEWIWKIAALIKEKYHATMTVIGPTDAPVAKVKDYWRRQLYAKTSDHEQFTQFLRDADAMEPQMLREKVYLSVMAL